MNLTRLLISIAVILLIALAAIMLWLRPTSLADLQNLVLGAATENAMPTTADLIRAGNYSLRATLDPEQPRVGKNTLTIDVFDENQQPIAKATLRAVAEMPAMGNMAAMRVTVDFEEIKAGRYRGTLDLPMAGEWPLAVDVDTTTLGHADVRFELSTAQKGLRATVTTPEGIAYYTCSMHNEVRAAGPGQCPICSMDLVPVKRSDIESGGITLDESHRQTIGVTTAVVKTHTLSQTLRLPGIVQVPENQQRAIAVKAPGWIVNLQADYLGKTIKIGAPLFTFYSPDLLAAQQEYVDSLKRGGAFLAASTRKLKLLDLTDQQIAEIARTQKPLAELPRLAPINGIVLSKNVVAGSPVDAGMEVLRLADLSTVWVEAAVFAQDLPAIALDTTAQVVIAGHSEPIAGKVIFIAPSMDIDTRTTKIRLQLNNPDGTLRPGDYAEVSVENSLGSPLVIPASAVIYSGLRRVVFVDEGNGQLKPRTIEVGAQVGDLLEVREGLQAGERVVSSGVFLVAAESKLKTGNTSW